MDIDYIINHLGEDRSQWNGAITPPTYQTSNFAFETVASLRHAFSDEKKHHIYSRGNNPTVEILRKKLAALEKTDDALVFSSGIAAISAAVCSVLKSGDHVVCVQHPYSWTSHLLSEWLVRFGVSTTFVSDVDTDDILDHCTSDTRLIYLESPNTMTFGCQDFSRIASFAREKNIVTITDNSYCSPIFQNPATFGIDLIVHSASKYINGHSDVIAGVVCGRQDLIDRIFHEEFMTLGAIPSPHEASMILRGLRTLPLRVRRSYENSLTIARWLQQHPKIRRVLHPGLPDFPQVDLVARQMTGTGGLFSFELDTEDIHTCERFAETLQYFMMAVSWGGHESLIFPICTFHGEGSTHTPHLPFQFFRMYVGLEDAEVLIKDLETALDKV